MEELFLKTEEGLFLTGLPESDSPRWAIKPRNVRRAIKLARDTAPGPDGIPSSAYKKLGEGAITILHEVATSLCTSTGVEELKQAYSDRCGEGSHDFNRSLLCCLPKKPTGTDPEAGEFFNGESTRPLALVNTDNRILASAARIAWEPLLDGYICANQQGFLKGRQMLNNVIDIDYQSMTVSLKCEKGAVVFFDFKAAFPSVAHNFLKESLALIGLPPHALHFVNSLYDDNICNISYKGNIYEGFRMECGVRQGCPISPLLFATSVDILLRILNKRIPEGHVRAFADDIGLVVEDWVRDGSVVKEVFDEFARMSGLDLNIPKTVLVPLWPEGITEAPGLLRRHCPGWENLKVSGVGTYLGFKSGPDKGDSSWTAPTSKFTSRVRKWEDVNAGAQYATLAYNTFALSTLLFVAQLEDPPTSTLDDEKRGLRRAVGGGQGWHWDPVDYYYQKELYGQSRSHASLRNVALASKLRVYHTHTVDRGSSRNAGNLSIFDMHRSLESLMRNTSFGDRLCCWRKWYPRSHASCVAKAVQKLAEMGIQRGRCLTEIAGVSERDWDNDIRDKQKRELQKFVSKNLKDLGRPDPIETVRKRLKRFMDDEAPLATDISQHFLIPGPIGHIAPKVHRRIQKLPRLVPPRVAHAVFRGIWNDWCTARRMQRRDQPCNVCMMGCPGGAEDSIEHYARCPVAIDVFKRKLHVDLHPRRGTPVFALAAEEMDDDEVLAVCALYIYGVYMTTNRYRATGLPSRDQTHRNRAKQCLGQYIIQGCQGHPKLGPLHDGRWGKSYIHISSPV